MNRCYHCRVGDHGSCSGGACGCLICAAIPEEERSDPDFQPLQVRWRS